MIITCGSFVVDNSGRILLCRATGTSHGWGVPKGLPRKDEEYLVAAKRELIEETGIDIDLFPHKMSELGKSIYIHKKKTIVGFLFLVDGVINQELVCKSTFFDIATRTNLPEVDKYMWVSVYKALDVVSAEQSVLLLRCLKN